MASKMTVKRLRKLIANMPDDAIVRPIWYRVPGDDDPGVEFHDMRVELDMEQKPFLAVMVGLFRLNQD